VIRSWRNAASRKVWDGDRPNRLRGLDFEAAVDLLLALNVATTLQDISPLNSVGLHKLKGDRAGRWARPWRVCFEFRTGRPIRR
jgi:proteic killer suppression protein